jgi:hypothetical protein
MNPAPATKAAAALPAMRAARAAWIVVAAHVNARPAKPARQAAIARADDQERRNRSPALALHTARRTRTTVMEHFVGLSPALLVGRFGRFGGSLG